MGNRTAQKLRAEGERWLNPPRGNDNAWYQYPDDNKILWALYHIGASIIEALDEKPKRKRKAKTQ